MSYDTIADWYETEFLAAQAGGDPIGVHADAGVRAKVGASHWPLPALLSMFTDAGLVAQEYHEGGGPSPITFSARFRKG